MSAPGPQMQQPPPMGDRKMAALLQVSRARAAAFAAARAQASQRMKKRCKRIRKTKENIENGRFKKIDERMARRVDEPR